MDCWRRSRPSLTKLGPILDLEIVREPQGWTEGGPWLAFRWQVPAPWSDVAALILADAGARRVNGG